MADERGERTMQTEPGASRGASTAGFRAARTIACVFLGLAMAACSDSDGTGVEATDGREIFRHDTFGSERFWTDTLRMHEVIRSGVSPRTALGVGLKVDSDAVPPGILETDDLADPATT